MSDVSADTIDVAARVNARPELALFTVKRDIETQDDTKLAALEIEGLTGIAPVALRESGASSDVARAAIEIAGDANRVFAAQVGADQITQLRARIAMSDQILVQSTLGFEAFATAQTALELSTSKRDVIVSPGSRVSRTKNSYLTHGFHKYKAKFFPRMARALTNHVCPSGTVGDPYMGSGTLGVEARLMGLSAVGIDIDPLSVMISNLKATALSLPADVLGEAIAQVSMQLKGGLLFDFADTPPSLPGQSELPHFIGRKASDMDREPIELETARIRGAIATVPGGAGRDLLLLGLSHALATKVSLRWMGTGDPRFSLSIAKRPLGNIFFAHLDLMHRRLQDRDSLRDAKFISPTLGNSSTELGDARALPWQDSSIDGIVTSPPYLPASSGRETYLRSRAPSLVALGLLTEEQLLLREGSLVGSIDRSAPSDSVGLPPSVRELVEWMLPQRARRPKALPTAAYFLDIAASLREMGRTLKPGGKAAVVLSYQHVFYDALTRQHVRTVVMPDIVDQLIADPENRIDLTVRAVHKLQLPKMDYAARPASTGDYAEAVIVLQRN
ncbi:DNA methyltransferase [uncultured Microbacterium sp.]|uniref:DNA methyltransferase n=1 Tax=uncultured Microbacterium sp. TaxID=191216 RepID=UPI002605370F|nr:DNA methyltransferase [uncultured Microbacterium sp.]